VSLYFYSYQGYTDGVKTMCGHKVRELNNNPEKAIKEAIQIIRDSNDCQPMNVHFLAFNKV
jgi:hypothetical protein